MKPTWTRLADQPGRDHREARAFCLAVIKEVYGFDHRADWHADLDSLLRPSPESQFSTINRGAFWVLRDDTDAIIATAGIKRLDWQPHLVAALGARYPDPGAVATLVRAYVRADRRGRGIGARLNARCEEEARRLGYDRIYLHANTGSAAARFWRGRGYGEFGRMEFSTHFDKVIAPA